MYNFSSPFGVNLLPVGSRANLFDVPQVGVEMWTDFRRRRALDQISKIIAIIVHQNDENLQFVFTDKKELKLIILYFSIWIKYKLENNY